MVAMSPRRTTRPFTRISVSPIFCSSRNWPLGRTYTRSLDVVNSSRSGHGVLRVDRVGDLLRGQPEFRELRVRDLDVDALLLVGDEVDLVDVGTRSSSVRSRSA